MEINYQAAQFYLNSANILLTFALGLYVYVSGRNRASQAAMDEHTRRINEIDSMLKEHHPRELRDDLHDLENQLGKLAVSVEHLPNEEQIIRVHSRIDSLSESVNTMRGQLSQINANVHLISEYLMKKNG